MSMIKVKPLSWKLVIDEMTMAMWISNKGFGDAFPLFEIARYDGDPRFHLVKVRTGQFCTSHPTLEAAKQAAQLEWERFILSTCNL